VVRCLCVLDADFIQRDICLPTETLDAVHSADQDNSG
jgi:hypothetical protein